MGKHLFHEYVKLKELHYTDPTEAMRSFSFADRRYGGCENILNQ